MSKRFLNISAGDDSKQTTFVVALRIIKTLYGMDTYVLKLFLKMHVRRCSCQILHLTPSFAHANLMKIMRPSMGHLFTCSLDIMRHENIECRPIYV